MKLEVHARSSVRSKARKFHYSTVQYTTNNYVIELGRVESHVFWRGGGEVFQYLGFCLFLFSILIRVLLYKYRVRVVCVMSSHLFWTSGLWTYQSGVTQEEGHTEFLHLPSSELG